MPTPGLALKAAAAGTIDVEETARTLMPDLSPELTSVVLPGGLDHTLDDEHEGVMPALRWRAQRRQ